MEFVAFLLGWFNFFNVLETLEGLETVVLRESVKGMMNKNWSILLTNVILLCCLKLFKLIIVRVSYQPDYILPLYQENS
jgi:hypothetical protein